MRTLAIVATLALLCVCHAYAQIDPKTTMPVHGTHECLMADEQIWTSLGLTKEQLTKVNELQVRCKKECDTAMKEKKMDKTMMDDHENELKVILTTDQYVEWTKWCTEANVQKPVEKPTTKY